MSLGDRGSLEPYIKDEIKFYPHQIEGIRKLARMKSFLLADDMGLGKSVQSLAVFGIDVYMGYAKSAIIICPATLKGNWIEEIEKFTGFVSVELGSGFRKDGVTPRALSKAERDVQIEQFASIDEAKILVVNYEQVVTHLAQLQELKFDVSIFDEAHYLKNPRAKRTKACMELYTPRSFLLTGSPLLNRVDELWTILYRISPAEYPNYWSFRARYCVFGGFKNKEVVGVQNEKELTNRLQSIMVRRLKKDVLNLKEPQFIKRFVNLSPLQQKMYDEIVNELKLTVDGIDSPMEIENALTKLLRLKQICGTTATLISKDESYKLDLAISDAFELTDNGYKIVTFTQFRGVKNAYINRAKDAMPNVPVFELDGDIPIPARQEIVSSWSKVKGPAIIVCMIQVAGLGLNMTQARHVQFIDKLFVPKLNQQAVDRVHRIGQDENEAPQIFEYIARGTVEKRVEEILRTKSKLFDDVVETSSWKKLLVEAVLRGEA